MFSIIYCDGNQGVWKWPGNKANVFPVVNSIIFMDKECARPCWLSSFTLMVLFIESLSLEDSVNTKFYKTALSHLCSQTMPWEVVHQLLNSAPWQYLASQVCYHKQIFWRNNISLLPHHPYSSDLAPSVSSCSHMLRKQWNVRDSMQSKRFKPTWQANMGYYRCLSEMLLRLTWTLCNKCVQSPTLRELKPTCW